LDISGCRKDKIILIIVLNLIKCWPWRVLKSLEFCVLQSVWTLNKIYSCTSFLAAPEGSVTFTRKVLRNAPKWDSSVRKLTRLYTSAQGTIEDNGTGMLQVGLRNLSLWLENEMRKTSAKLISLQNHVWS
jgi:hypothetical protein